MADERWDRIMQSAIDEARLAPNHGDVPIGAVVLDGDGVTVAVDHNRREERSNPIAHAETLVLAAASQSIGSWRLTGHTLVVTLEPCVMCAGAALQARVDRIVYGAPDLKAGAVWSLYNIPQDVRLNHHIEVVAGVREAECATLLTEFFAGHRDRPEPRL